MQTYLLPLILIFQPLSAYAYSYQELKSLIKERNIKTVEQLTEVLPDELQRNITFKFNPHNRLQGGYRAIRFTSDGALVLTHNDDANKLGGRNVEIIEKNRSGEQILHEITFANDGISAPHFSEKNPKLCITCHGQPVRKIWPAYPFWADTCGESEDRIEPRCQEFLRTARSNPRFKDLKWDMNNPAWPYKTNSTGIERPNHSLSYLTEIDNARQFANHVQENSVFKKLKYSLFAYALCEPSQVEIFRLRNVVKSLADVALPENWVGSRSEYVDGLFSNQTEYTSADVKSSIYHDPLNISIIGAMGVPYGNVGGNEHVEFNGQTGIGTGYGELTNSSLGYTLTNLLISVSLEDPVIALAIEDDILSERLELFSRNYSMVQGIWSGFTIIYQSRIDRICDHLKERSELEIEAIQAKNKQPNEDRALRDTMPEVELGKYLLGKHNCIGCHDNGARNVGPAIPFGDPQKFVRENSARPYWESWRVRSEVMMSNEVSRERRMPLNGRDLYDYEKQAILRYLDSITN